MNYSHWVIFLLELLLANLVISASNVALDFGYHNYVSYTDILKNFAAQFPTKAYLYSIGKSVQNRELWVLALADSNPDKHLTLRPEVKYIGNMHGNEVPSKEVLLHLIEYMLMNQTADRNVDFLMKKVRTHILVSMNPDGFEMSSLGDCYSIYGRYNANGYDLNRNFPDYFACNSDQIQQETQSIINWLNSNEFVLSANLHGGAMVVNYPYDNIKSGFQSNSPTMDDDVFRAISLTYSLVHPTMKNPNCGNSFRNGITNGAAWYPVVGGMQDYNYWRFGCYELTIELSCCKYPPANQLQKIWSDNRVSLIEYLKNADKGVKGVVSFDNGQLAQNITVKIDSREPYFKTNKYGEYYRILLPGTYKLDLMFNCTLFYSVKFTIPASNGSLRLDIKLSSATFYSRYLSFSNSLNKYAQFCSITKSPNACSQIRAISTNTSIISETIAIKNNPSVKSINVNNKEMDDTQSNSNRLTFRFDYLYLLIFLSGSSLTTY